ncbi:Uncharacterized protein SCF082_LOCUS19941 [Durusdinium trenchii]|uniref:Uncharacterized protein n=1 Tax=Durusdinium trenchii TaxID=1381693 RepID=A0ABP0KZ24_9DINO
MSPEELCLVVSRLAALGVPKDFIWLVVFTYWYTLGAIHHFEGLQVIEMFAGVARVAKVASRLGLRSRAFEIMFDASHGKKRYKKNGHMKRSFMDMNGDAGFALAVALILASKWGDCLALLAIVCSSFSVVNRGTSERDELIPWGASFRPSVRTANKMTTRSTLLFALVACMDSVFLLENPGGSCIMTHPRLAWLVKRLYCLGMPVFRTFFWMANHGAPTPKRTQCVSNSATIRKLDLGLLRRAGKVKEEDETTITYENQEGEKKFKGAPGLKKTQIYTPRFAKAVVNMVPQMKWESRESIPVANRIAPAELPGFVSGLEWSAWEEAELADCLVYLRKSSKLVIPNEWASVVPDLKWFEDI